MSELVEPAASAPYAAFAIAVCAIERDVRLSELTPDEIDFIVGAVVAAERDRAARIARSYEEGLSAPECVSRDHPGDAYLTGVADAAAAIEDAIRSGDAG